MVELEKEEVQVQIDDIKRMYGSVNEHLEQNLQFMIDHGRLGEELEWKEMYLEEINQRLQRVQQNKKRNDVKEAFWRKMVEGVAQIGALITSQVISRSINDDVTRNNSHCWNYHFGSADTWY
ncbi:hypothetical protein DEO72_LG1g125 [Vigna unguiculata]|uniref:Uncharacterized protein n=1 Tax=Vigna unguiculata TaxID=3917 RepID=A0A4D6KFN8_VIGUN|nr:hypothetical protein DEO72_LG1g125 [Vigna unguiculata]